MDDLFSCDDKEEKETELATPTPTTPTCTSFTNERDRKKEIEEEGEKSEDRFQNEHLIKITTEGDTPTLYLLINSCDDIYTIEATDTRQAWVGVVSHQDIKKTAKSAKGSEYDYLQDTRNALTGSGCGSFLYSTRLFSHDNSLELSWKKHLVSDNIRLFLGSVVMETHLSSTIYDKMLEYSVGGVSTYRKRVSALKRERDRLLEEKRDTLKKLEQVANIKEEIEADLYGKFKLVLNEKKAKIRRLMESLDHATSHPPSSSHDLAPPPPESDKEEDTPSPKHKEGGVSILNDEWADQDTAPPTRKRTRVKKGKGGSSLQKLCKPLPSRRSRSVSSSRDTEEQMGSQDLINMM